MRIILFMAISACIIAILVISFREEIRLQIVNYLVQNLPTSIPPASPQPAVSLQPASNTPPRQPAPPAFIGPTGEPHIIGPRGNPPNY